MNGTIPLSRAQAQAHNRAGATETDARDRIAPKAGKIRGRLLFLLVEAGDDGLTATEAYRLYAQAFGEPRGGLYSISPRLSELERRGGWAKATDIVRDRRQAYVATDLGRAWAEGQSR